MVQSATKEDLPATSIVVAPLPVPAAPRWATAGDSRAGGPATDRRQLVTDGPPPAAVDPLPIRSLEFLGPMAAAGGGAPRRRCRKWRSPAVCMLRFLASNGARVTLAARRADALASAVGEINDTGQKAQSVVLTSPSWQRSMRRWRRQKRPSVLSMP